MKRTAIAIAVGALSIGLSQGLLAQEEETQPNEEQQMTEEGAQEHELDQDSQGQGADVHVEGEPADVTVEETGEADVEVERAEEAEAEMREPDQQDQAQQDPDQVSQDQAAEGNDLMDREISEIEGYTLYSQEEDEEIGDVERVVRDTQSNDIYVVITKGGFLGFGRDEMGFKVDDLELRNDDELVVRSSDDGESGDYGSDQYEELDGNQTLREAMQSN